jgi:hypothetical protein
MWRFCVQHESIEDFNTKLRHACFFKSINVFPASIPGALRLIIGLGQATNGNDGGSARGNCALDESQPRQSHCCFRPAINVGSSDRASRMLPVSNPSCRDGRPDFTGRNVLEH